MRQNHYDYLIWDFNGTILDDVDACIQSANLLLSRHGLPAIPSRDFYQSVFGFPIIDYYRRLGFDFDRLPYEELAVEWVTYYLAHSKASPLCPFVAEVLKEVKSRGISQWILSATEVGMLGRQVKGLGIDSFFEGILGLDNIHAGSKEQIGVNFRKQHPDARMLMIGDTDHDADVAHAMGIDCVLVSSGHQSKKILEQYPCLFVAGNASEILKVL